MEFTIVPKYISNVKIIFPGMYRTYAKLKLHVTGFTCKVYYVIDIAN
jgi:hypothetical protein